MNLPLEKAIEGAFKTIAAIIVISVPLALWKVVEIVIWLWNKVEITIR